MKKLSIAMVVVMSGVARAQSAGGDVDLQAFRPAMDSRGYVTVNASEVLGHMDLSFGLVTTWGYRVLELEKDGMRYSVENLVTPTLQAALGLFGRAELGVTAPFHVMDGDFTGQGIGDVGLHGKVRLLETSRHPFGLAVVTSVFVPAHEPGSWLGEESTTVLPGLVVDKELGRVRAGANLGYRHRPERTFMAPEGMAMTAGSELPFGVGAAYALVPGRFEVVGEVYGGAPLAGQSWFPLEAVGGIKVYLAENSYFTLGGGAGSADARAFLGIVFEQAADRDAGSVKDDVEPPAPRRPDPAPVPVPVPKVTRTSQGRIDVLENIYFETDSAVIKPESYGILDAIAEAVRGWPDIRLLEVQGHADERGTDAYNLSLTQARAESVVRYLTEKGIETGRLRPRGFGESRPVDGGHTEAAWSKNRRVEFVIIE